MDNDNILLPQDLMQQLGLFKKFGCFIANFRDETSGKKTGLSHSRSEKGYYDFLREGIKLLPVSEKRLNR